MVEALDDAEDRAGEASVDCVRVVYERSDFEPSEEERSLEVLEGARVGADSTTAMALIVSSVSVKDSSLLSS